MFLQLQNLAVQSTRTWIGAGRKAEEKQKTRPVQEVAMPWVNQQARKKKMKNLVGGRGALPVEQRTRSAPAPQRGGHSSFCKLGERSGSGERGIEWYRPRNKDLDVLHLHFKI